MPRRQLGRLDVSQQGLGCMGMSELRGPVDRAEAIATIHRAIELGIDLLDTSNIYGFGSENERLLAEALKGRRHQAVIATKFGIVRPSADLADLPGARSAGRNLDGRPEYVRKCCEESLRNLATDVIDLYYVHRVDPEVPIEDTVGAMGQLVAEGKVRHLGLSEPSVATLRRANAVHPIAAVQSEWSLWARDIEAEIVPACRELGAGIVPYSPLGRGFLTATIAERRFDQGDMRNFTPWFSEENFDRNLALTARARSLAQEKGCTPGQLALAWLAAKGNDVVAIPGTKRRAYLEENAGAVEVRLDPAEVARLDAAFPPGSVAGDRYVDMSSIAGDTC